jgi:hypothetical protein
MIDQRLVALALEAVDTHNFERFAQTFYGAIQDREFVPLGGVHDGGAEGFDAQPEDPDVFVDEAATSFIQVSKQVTTRQKIRSTVKRLREYGRTPKVVTYITSLVVPDIDKVEAALSQELQCRISIRDAKYIEAYINSNLATQGAFHSFLQPSISYIYSPGVSELGEQAAKHVDRTLAVFLRQEVDSQSSNGKLLDSVADSLIIWALRDTDPDPSKGRLLVREEILALIETALPAAKVFIRGTLDHRLARLCAKDAPGGRQIRHYKKSDSFCLPFETREAVAIENADDDLLKLRVSCVFEDRLNSENDENLDSHRALIVDVCHTALERVFEHQGLKLAQFVQNAAEDDELYTDVARIATEAVSEIKLDPQVREDVRRYALHVLRGTFYKSSEVERLYLGKLSRTYILMLLLKNDARIVDHFSSISSKLFLYLGSDVIIRAISELYLAPESQTTVNLIKILRSAGAKLALTEKTVDEVATHVRSQIFEFENMYASTEHHVNSDIVEYIDRILIRSYFYAKLIPGKGVLTPRNWHAYVSQFCNYTDVRNNVGDHELADYLIRKFDLVYETAVEMGKGIDPEKVERLCEEIAQVRTRAGKVKPNAQILAYNDALQVLRVYQRRLENGENSPGNPFGFQTWWLTQDQKVRRGAARAVRDHGGKFFMMRPEFLLSYVGFAPNLAEVRKSYKTVFPSSLGVRLSYGIKTEQFEKVMRDASEISKVDDARAGAMISAMTEKLKADAYKQFDSTW